MRVRWILYALLFSVAVNVAAVSVLVYYWTTGPKESPRRVHPGTHPQRWGGLNLTKAQKAAFDSIRTRYLHDMRPLWEKLWRERSALADVALGSVVDSSRVRKHVDQITLLQTKMELRTLRFFRELKEVLTPEQVRHFRKMIEDRMRRDRPPVVGKPKPRRIPNSKQGTDEQRGGGQHEETRSNRSRSRCDAFWCGNYMGTA